MAAVKGGYDSHCWVVRRYGHKLNIYIKANATSSEELRKWRILMTKCETEPNIALLGYNDADLEKKSFQTIFIPLFCDMLKKNMVIKQLTLIRQILNDVGMKYVCRVLQTHSTITVVGLIDFPWVSDSMGSELEHLLIHNKSIKTLEVRRNEQWVRFIAKALPHNSTLTYLDFGASGVGDKDLKILSKALMLNHSLTKIDLSMNSISNEGAEELCAVCEVNHSLTDINLSYNSITAVPEAFAFLTHIKTLKLSDNRGIRFPPENVVRNRAIQFEFFADFRCGRMKFHFLLGFHERVGRYSSMKSYLDQSSIFEPALLGCIFEFV